MQKRQKGKLSEDLVKQKYLNENYKLEYTNFATRSGEIDLIFSYDNQYIFVEVKDVSNIYNIGDYITNKKLNFIKKTIKFFLKDKYYAYEFRLDVVFVKNDKIYEIFENIYI